MDLRDRVADALEEARDGEFHAAVFAFLPLRYRHHRLRIREQRINKRRDIFRTVLQVAVHEHNQVVGRQREPGSDSTLLTEITAQPHRADMLVGLANL